MPNNKYLILIGTAIGIVIILGAVFLFTRNRSSDIYVTATGESVPMANVSKIAVPAGSGIVLIAQDDSLAKIVYNKSSQVFSLIVRANTVSEFSRSLPLAEQLFLGSLGITKEGACKLSVEVSMAGPTFDPPKSPADIRSLSFCQSPEGD